VNSIFIPDFPLTLPLSPDSGGEGGVRGNSHGVFYATFRFIWALGRLKNYDLVGSSGTNKMGAGICDKVFRNLTKDPKNHL
jgi:hypothetical protein